MVHNSLRILMLALVGAVVTAAGNLRSAAPPANSDMQLVEAIAAHHPTAGELASLVDPHLPGSAVAVLFGRNCVLRLLLFHWIHDLWGRRLWRRLRRLLLDAETRSAIPCAVLLDN